MKKIFMSIFSLISVFLMAFSWRSVIVDENGTVVRTGYENDSKSTHVYKENEYPADYIFPTNAFIYWKKVGSDWVGMTTNEQAIVNNAIAEPKSDLSTWQTNLVDGTTLADAFRALIICINRRLPAGTNITANEFKTELKKQLLQ